MAAYKFLLRRNTASDWAILNPILLDGEIGYELDKNRFKIGDGTTRWLLLDYFLPASDIRKAIADAISAAGGMGSDGSGGWEAALQAHVNSTTPHTVYDDGPSLSLLYENAKV